MQKAAVLVLTTLLAGCAGDAARLKETATWSRLKPKPPQIAPDVVEMRYIFLEREQGDRLINQKIWAEADEQAVPLEQRALLADNGIRIGKLGTRLTPELLEMLEKSPDGKEGRQHQTHSGSMAKVQATGQIPKFQIFSVVDGQPRGEELEDAQCYLHVTPTLGEGQTIKLALMPEVEYGPRLQKHLPAPDLSGWQIRTDREARSFPELKVDMVLSSGEYALIGCHPDREGTVGGRFFTRQVGAEKKQTVLLVRVVRPSREDLYTAGFDYDDFFISDLKRVSTARSPVRETVLASQRISEQVR